jgi:hypothetical protein
MGVFRPGGDRVFIVTCGPHGASHLGNLAQRPNLVKAFELGALVAVNHSPGLVWNIRMGFWDKILEGYPRQ